MDDLVERDGLFYKKFTDVPFTGEITDKTAQGTFRNGKKEGPWVRYHDNGQLSSKRTYKNGEKDGPWVGYWSNGQLFYKGTYKDGKRDGPWVFYNEDGTVWKEYKGTFKDGTPVDGLWVSYHDNGRIHFEGTVKDGKEDGPWVYYH